MHEMNIFLTIKKVRSVNEPYEFGEALCSCGDGYFVKINHHMI